MKNPLIIAEAGVNHNGDINKAIQLVAEAAKSGADVVKFQTFSAEKLVTREAKKAAYQEKMTPSSDSQFSMLKSLELSHSDHKTLIEKCKENKIEFLSTAFDSEGIDYLVNLGIKRIKIPSGELTNFPYLQKAASFGLPVILSTGMAELEEIDWSIKVLLSHGLQKEDLTILHCTTAYPTPIEEVNLKAMNSIAAEFEVKVGYSDHTLGINVPIAATALGAVVIEKHFTLDKSLPGPDHSASLEPNELKEMVEAIKEIANGLGDGIKKPTKTEVQNKTSIRKSIFLNKELKEGSIISSEDIIPLRPGDGIPSIEWQNVIGKKLQADLKSGEKLKWDHLK